MSRTWCWAKLGVVGMLAILGSGASAQDKHGQAELNHSLREAINVGADLFNRYGDHAGCYRVFQGALVAVKPFLTPELQKKVADAMEKAEKQPAFSDRAFELRAMIDEIRDKTKGPSAPEPKPEKSAESPGTQVPGKSSAGPGISGQVTYEGKPVPAGYFVTLVSEEGRSFSTAVQKDGAFAFRTPLSAGRYRLQIETFLEKGPPPATLELPARYRSADTSGLALQIEPGPRFLDVNLVK